MKHITFTDKFIAYMTLFCGLCISAVAIYYSVAGLVAIFAAAAVPIIVMGVVLEVSKLVATIWLKQNWTIAPKLIRLYLFTAVMVLMMITSMGIFGFLSKAHIDQGIPTGDVAAQVVLIDEKIKVERDNIDNARSLIGQLDGVVNALTTGQDRTAKRKDGSEFTISSAERALTTRRSQSKDRAALTKQIEAGQANIIKLQVEKAPFASSLRKVEAEVGPIRYIAALIYGDNPDTNTLERAVRWVIIIIVAVFDPLAVVLLLASQYSFAYFRQRREEDTDAAAAIINEVKKQEPYVKGDDGFKFLAEHEDLHKLYPASDAEIDELAAAKDTARSAVIGDTYLYEAKPFDFESDTTPLPLVAETVTIKDEPAAEVEKTKRTTKIKEIAPPGTPGEEWAVQIEEEEVNSEQQGDDNLDKIYKASAEDLAKKNRSRGWFQAVFPKKDNT